MEQRDEQNDPIPFSLECVSYDRKKKEGGKLIQLDKVVILTSSNKYGTAAGKKTKATAKRNPNHSINATRNLYNIANKTKLKINIRLLTKINGMAVQY